MSTNNQVNFMLEGKEIVGLGATFSANQPTPSAGDTFLDTKNGITYVILSTHFHYSGGQFALSYMNIARA